MSRDFWIGYIFGVVVVYFITFFYGIVKYFWKRHKERQRNLEPKNAIVTGVELSEDENGIKLVGTVTDDFWVDNLRKFQAEQHYSLRYAEYPADPKAEFDDFDIDYNMVAIQRDPELQDILEKLHRPGSFVQMASDPVTFAPTEEGIRVQALYCGSLNSDPAYPYRCVRNRGHDQVPTDHLDPDESQYARHGYGGVFWD